MGRKKPAQSRVQRKLSADWLYDRAMATALGFVRDLRAVGGVSEVLKQLAQSGARTCVASQFPLVRVKLSLLITGLDWFFGDHIYTASMEAAGNQFQICFSMQPSKWVHTRATAQSSKIPRTGCMRLRGRHERPWVRRR